MFTNNESSPVFIFLLGLVVGLSFYDDKKTIEKLKWIVNVIAAIYTIIVFILLTAMSFRRIGNNLSSRKLKFSNKQAVKPYERPLEMGLEAQKTKKVKAGTASNEIPELVQIETVAPSNETIKVPKEIPVVEAKEERETNDALKLIDLNGSYRLEKNINFLNFLAAQGVSWALRSAANKAIMTHHITHKESMLKIKVQGIISSETVYTINGPPIQTKIKDRIYMDTVSYLENGQGVKVTKVNEEHNYTINVVRTFSPDKKLLITTSTAKFADGKTVEAIQQYRRLEPDEK